MSVSQFNEILDLPLLDAADKIRRRDVSSRELVLASVTRAEDLQGTLNAFIRIEKDQALAAADAADREIAAGNYRGPLHGIPLAHKDMFYRKGEITSAGSLLRRDFRGEVTSHLVTRLDNAGAVTVGWLNLSEFCGGPTGHNEHFGDCRNPWNPECITGGSSSGAGASVAARIVFGALGSDTGGSIRIPAGFCGVVGAKATYGLVTRHGALPRAWSLDHIGPLTRTVADAAVMLQCIAGTNPGDPTAWVGHIPDYYAELNDAAPKLRIGIPRAELAGASPEVLEVFENAIRVLEDAGYTTVDITFPDLVNLARLNDVISKSEAATIHRDGILNHPEKYGDHVRTRIESGLAIPASRYLEAQTLRTTLSQSFVADVFSRCDVVCLPTMLFGAPTRAETDPKDASEILNMVLKIANQTRPFNYLGLPAFSVPMGFDARKMPLGLQMIGPPLAESRLFSLGHQFQKGTDWHNAKPPSAA